MNSVTGIGIGKVYYIKAFAKLEVFKNKKQKSLYKS